MCMVGDYDYWEFYNEYTPTARKDHRCQECGRTIAKGEKYCTQGGLNDGHFQWYKTCAHCDAASRWLSVVCDGWIFGRRREDFGEHVVGYEKDIRSRPLVRLYRWMVAKWQTPTGELRSVDDVEALTEEAVVAYRRQAARVSA